jgi:hypothetical protein
MAVHRAPRSLNEALGAKSTTGRAGAWGSPPVGLPARSKEQPDGVHEIDMDEYPTLRHVPTNAIGFGFSAGVASSAVVMCIAWSLVPDVIALPALAGVAWVSLVMAVYFHRNMGR